MTSRVMARTGLNSESHFTERNTRNGRHALMEPKEIIRPSGIAPMSVMKNILSVCTKPTFNA